MPRKPKAARKANQEITHLGISVTGHDACIEVGLNHAMRTGGSWYPDLDEPVIASSYSLTISGSVHYPEERAGEQYIVRLVAGSGRDKETSQRLRDIQVKDEHGIPRCRKYREGSYPVLEVPEGMTAATRMREPPGWHIWATVPAGVLSNMLTLLGQSRPLFLAITEVRRGRERWIRSVGLQTIDPMVE